MTANMDQALLGTLCETDEGEGAWLWDAAGGTMIKFNKDGTGTLRCGVEMLRWIAAEFEWKPLGPWIEGASSGGGSGSSSDAKTLGQLDIELTLTKRAIERHGHINEKLLTEDAFLPKKYTVRLEQGKFMAPAYKLAKGRKSYATTKYALRLVFDKSPIPPRKEWKDEEALAVDRCRVWEWDEFVYRGLPKEEGWASVITEWTSPLIALFRS